MNRTEAKAHYQALAKKAGVKEDDIKSILDAFDNESLGNLLLEGFIPRPEYSSALDQRDAKIKEAQAEAKRMLDWYEKEGKPAYETNAKGVALLRKYEEMYGPLDDTSSTKDRKDAAKASGMSREEIEELITKREERMSNAFANLTKSAIKISQDYTKRFGKELDFDAFEKFALEKQLPIEVAYREYVEPQARAVETESWEKRIKEARAEGERDALSKHKLPMSEPHRDPHPLFDQKSSKDTDEQTSEKNSRNAFLDGWNKAADTVVEQNR